MTLINLLIISSIVCFIVDISGITDTLRHFLWKRYIGIGNYKNLSLKPFDCSLCLTFHAGWIYLLIIGQFTLFNFAFVCLLSLLSSNITDVLQLTRDIVTYAVTTIYRWLNI